MPDEHVDVLIVGAGLSGIGAAVHLQRECPNHRFAIVESRDAIGGTWDLFRYPGVRSDSDMFTLGYRFKPWRQAKVMADGPAILDYVRETAHEHGIAGRIRFRHRVTAAHWSSQDACWSVELAQGDAATPVRIRCNFLYLCAGYYRYDSGYTPELPGRTQFGGQIVHPQQWSDAIDYSGKRVIVIGSGATAITLVPELAKKATHVTLLQRSPTYMVALPSRDALADRLRRHLPARLAHGLIRWQRILMGMAFFALCRRFPDRMKRLMLGRVGRSLGPDADIGTDFTPSYKPWDQRLCLVPDADLFKAIRSGAASVVTDTISHFTTGGIRLQSGRQLDADLVVTATGLQLQLLGGIRLTIDGQAVDPARTMSYKGLMFSGIPNLASCFGYTNASWTLKADLSSQYLCRLLRHMRREGWDQCTPGQPEPTVRERPWVALSSGYFQRALDLLPRQGSKPPWMLHQNYLRDLWQLRYARIDDGVLVFRRAGAGRPPAP